jgi:hypothetical protein
MCEECERYRWDDKNVFDAVSLDMSEELQDLELFHNDTRDPFEHGQDQAGRGSIDMAERSRVERDPSFGLGKVH